MSRRSAKFVFLISVEGQKMLRYPSPVTRLPILTTHRNSIFHGRETGIKDTDRANRYYTLVARVKPISTGWLGADVSGGDHDVDSNEWSRLGETTSSFEYIYRRIGFSGERDKRMSWKSFRAKFPSKVFRWKDTKRLPVRFSLPAEIVASGGGKSIKK